MAFLPLLLVLASCVKDVDLNQVDEVVIPPKAAIDLIFFTLGPEDLQLNGNGELTAKDGTRLDFLDDDYIQTSLVRADFNFRFINSFQSPATAVFSFRSANNAVQHQVEIPIPAGTGASPGIVDYTEIVDHTQIQKIRRSILLTVEIIVPDAVGAGQGELQLQSRGLYFFEFK